MEKQERILKFLQGRAIARKDYDEAKAQYENALAGATEEQQQMATAYLLTVANKLKSEKVSKKHAMHTSAEAYRVASAMLTDSYNPSLFADPLSGQSSGIRTRRIDYADARGAHGDFVELNTNRRNSTNTYTTSQTLPGRRIAEIYNFKFSEGIPLAHYADETLATKIQRYASGLLRNINNAEQAQNAGKQVIGGITDMYNDRDKAVLLRLSTSTGTSLDYNDLLDIAAKYDTTLEHWETYFGDLIPKASPSSINKAALVLEGWDTELSVDQLSQKVKQALDLHDAILLKNSKTQEYRVFNKDYTPYTGKAFDYINLSPGDSYGTGLLVGENGRTYFGNVADIDSESAYSDLLDAAKASRVGYDLAYVTKIFDPSHDYSENEVVNVLIKGILKKYPTRKKILYADVSKMFAGDGIVLAYNTDGTPIKSGSLFKEAQFTPQTKFLWYDPSTNTYIDSSLAQMEKRFGKINYKGVEGEDIELAGAIYDMSNVFEGVNTIDRDAKLRKTDWKSAALAGTSIGAGAAMATSATGPGAALSFALGFLGGAGADLVLLYFDNDSIGNQPLAFVDAALLAIKNPNATIRIPGTSHVLTGQTFLSLFSTQELLATIAAFVREGGAVISAEDERLIRDLYIKINPLAIHNSGVRPHKTGGILYAASGYELHKDEAPKNKWHEQLEKKSEFEKFDEDTKKAKEEGYDTAELYNANKSTKLSATDYMRFATMAQDAASIVASFVPGAGTGVAAGLGVTALGTDLVADIMDPAVSAGEAAANTVMNLGFAAIGLIPGAKMGKVAKYIVKYLPKVMTAAAGLGIAMDESTLKTFEKLKEGKLRLNSEDWRNISHVLSLVAAGTRGIRGDIARHQVNKGIVAKDNVKLKGVKNTNGDDFELPKSTVKEIDAKLAKASTAEEVAAIRELYNLPESAITLSRIRGKYSLVDQEKATNKEMSYENLRLMWAAEEKKVAKSSEFNKWFANAFGGGTYTAKQRAILELDPSVIGINPANLMEYRGNYNPMIDWEGRRNNYNQRTIPKSSAEIARDQAKFNAEVGRENVITNSALDIANPNLRKLSAAAEAAATLAVNAKGIKIDNPENFKQFIIDLRLRNPLYKTALTNKRFLLASKEQYKFNTGGLINSKYSYLRK